MQAFQFAYSDPIMDQRLIVVGQKETNKSNSFLNILKLKTDRKVNFTSVDAIANVDSSEILVALGSSVFRSLIKKYPSAPIIGVYITSIDYEDIKKNIDSNNNFSAIFSDADMDKYFQVIKGMKPTNPLVGLLYTHLSSEELEYIDRLSKKYAVHTNMVMFDQVGSIFELLNHHDKTDFIIGLPDREIYNGSTIRIILEACYDEGVGLLVFSEPFVKAGAMSGLVVNDEHLIDDLLSMIDFYNQHGEMPSAIHNSKPVFIKNKRVAESLNFFIDESNINKLLVDGGEF